MDIYDPRCWHFYELAIDVYPSLSYTSPYFVPGISNYAATITTANYKSGTPDAVYGVGVNLNHPSPKMFINNTWSFLFTSKAYPLWIDSDEEVNVNFSHIQDYLFTNENERNEFD